MVTSLPVPIRMFIDFLFFLEFAKFSFLFGVFLTLKQSKTTSFDKLTLIPVISFFISLFTTASHLFLPKILAPTIIFLCLLLSSYSSGSFLYLQNKFKINKRSKFATKISLALNLANLILMTIIMNPAPTETSPTAKVDLFFYMGIVLSAGLTTFLATKNIAKEDLESTPWLMIHLVFFVLLIISLITSLFFDIKITAGLFNIFLLAILPLFGSLLAIGFNIYVKSKEKFYFFTNFLILLVILFATITLTIINNPPVKQGDFFIIDTGSTLLKLKLTLPRLPPKQKGLIF